MQTVVPRFELYGSRGSSSTEISTKQRMRRLPHSEASSRPSRRRGHRRPSKPTRGCSSMTRTFISRLEPGMRRPNPNGSSTRCAAIASTSYKTRDRVSHRYVLRPEEWDHLQHQPDRWSDGRASEQRGHLQRRLEPCVGAGDREVRGRVVIRSSDPVQVHALSPWAVAGLGLSDEPHRAAQERGFVSKHVWTPGSAPGRSSRSLSRPPWWGSRRRQAGVRSKSSRT